MDGIKTRVSGRDREDQRDRGGCSESPAITSEAVYEYTLWPFCFSSLLSSLAFLILHYFLVRRRRFELIQPICFPLSPVLSRFLLFIGALIQSLLDSVYLEAFVICFGGKESAPFFLPLLTIASHIYIIFYSFSPFSLFLFYAPLPSFILSLIGSCPDFGTTEILRRNPWHSRSVKHSAASLYSLLFASVCPRKPFIAFN